MPWSQAGRLLPRVPITQAHGTHRSLWQARCACLPSCKQRWQFDPHYAANGRHPKGTSLIVCVTCALYASKFYGILLNQSCQAGWQNANCMYPEEVARDQEFIMIVILTISGRSKTKKCGCKLDKRLYGWSRDGHNGCSWFSTKFGS